jgi:Domain of unknown function (DUF5666)
MKIGSAFGLILMLCLVAVPTWAQSNKVLYGSGRVTAVSADSFTVQSGSVTQTFAVDAQTKVEGKGVGTKSREMKASQKSPVLSDLLSVADSVKVDYHDLGSGKLHAAKVRIIVKSFKQ